MVVGSLALLWVATVAGGQNPAFIRDGRDVLIPGPVIPLGTAVSDASLSRDGKFAAWIDLDSERSYAARVAVAQAEAPVNAGGAPLFRLDTRTGQRTKLGTVPPGTFVVRFEFVGRSGDVAYVTADASGAKQVWFAPVGRTASAVTPVFPDGTVSVLGAEDARLAFVAFVPRPAGTVRVFRLTEGGVGEVAIPGEWAEVGFIGNTTTGAAVLQTSPVPGGTAKSQDWKIAYTTGAVAPVSEGERLDYVATSRNGRPYLVRALPLSRDASIPEDAPGVSDLVVTSAQGAAAGQVQLASGVLSVLAESLDQRGVIYVTSDGAFFRGLIPAGPTLRRTILRTDG
ncbi:MAG: hypothetical protein SFX74_00145 [Fimbriimonadaceae bacterium]|nr:hypothetical protein [Fimbriimonadaceae bacterium]